MIVSGLVPIGIVAIPNVIAVIPNVIIVIFPFVNNMTKDLDLCKLLKRFIYRRGDGKNWRKIHGKGQRS